MHAGKGLGHPWVLVREGVVELTPTDTERLRCWALPMLLPCYTLGKATTCVTFRAYNLQKRRAVYFSNKRRWCDLNFERTDKRLARAAGSNHRRSRRLCLAWCLPSSSGGVQSAFLPHSQWGQRLKTGINWLLRVSEYVCADRAYSLVILFHSTIMKSSFGLHA